MPLMKTESISNLFSINLVDIHPTSATCILDSVPVLLLVKTHNS